MKTESKEAHPEIKKQDYQLSITVDTTAHEAFNRKHSVFRIDDRLVARYPTDQPFVVFIDGNH